MVLSRIIIKNYLEIVSYFFAYYTKNVVIFFTDGNVKNTDWFTPSHLGDRCNYSDRIGFLNWFKTDDLALIEKNCKWGVYEIGGKETVGNVIYRQFVLPSGTEIAGTVNSNEGSVFKYWLNKNGGAVKNDANSNRTIKRIDSKTSNQNAWLRSPYRGGTSYAWFLGTSGGINSGYYVYYSIYVAPLFII